MRLILDLFEQNFKNSKEYHSNFCFSNEEKWKIIYSFAKTMAVEGMELASPARISLEVGTKDLPEFFNFYFDPLQQELKLIYTPLINILQRCVNLIDEFGQNPIIDDIMSISHHILHLKINETSLMEALTSLELLLAKLETYEKIASKSLNSLEE